MQQVAPLGPVYQAGTLSGNPVAMAAGIATLDTLSAQPPYMQLERYGQALQEGLAGIFRQAGIPTTINRVGSMITVFFREGPVSTYAQAVASDTQRFKQFFHGLLQNGVYWPPSQFEAAFFSAAHTQTELERTLEVVEQVVREL
jgi:glutamate-1-semialdehyde 2,1-aminomutase